MKISCNIIKDLLPLYVENIVSNESKALVEEHLKSCIECQSKLQKMQQPVKLSADKDMNELKALKKLWNRGKLRIAIITSVSLILLFTCLISLYFVELPVKYSDGKITVTEEPLHDIDGFFLQVKGSGIGIIEVDNGSFSSEKSTLHYKVVWTSPIRNLLSGHSQEIGIPEYWKENTDFVSEIIIDFSDVTVIYRNGELVE